MNKRQLTKHVAQQTNVHPTVVELVYDKIIQSILAQAAASGKSSIPGLATVKVAVKPARPERVIRNPKTQEPIVLPPRPSRRVIRFRAVKDISELINSAEVDNVCVQNPAGH